MNNAYDDLEDLGEPYDPDGDAYDDAARHLALQEISAYDNSGLGYHDRDEDSFQEEALLPTSKKPRVTNSGTGIFLPPGQLTKQEQAIMFLDG